jgi:hypothetical protein
MQGLVDFMVLSQIIVPSCDLLDYHSDRFFGIRRLMMKSSLSPLHGTWVSCARIIASGFGDGQSSAADQ